MTPFNEISPTKIHKTIIKGLNVDPSVINKVYIRAKGYDKILELNYRCVGKWSHSYPRIGNLWGSWDFENIEEMANSGIKLWLGLHLTKDQLKKFKKLSPDSIVLTSINAIEQDDLPEDFYLHSPEGKRVEVWPDSYRLNMTKEKVWKYVAELAYELILESDLLYDGIFFDNFMTTQSWLNEDIYGNKFIIDSDEDGKPDDPEEFDRRWKEGLINEILYFKKLMPGAIISGHSIDGTIDELYKIFNGRSFGFYIADILENQMDFEYLLEQYKLWENISNEPQIIMFEGSPHDEIAYGYDYEPESKMPLPTLHFAKSYFQYMRFGLCFTLLRNGYYAYELGDTCHGNKWIYDEYYSDLGYPEGNYYEILIKEIPYLNLIPEGNFEDPENLYLFKSYYDDEKGYYSKLSYIKKNNNTMAKVEVIKSGKDSWRVDFGRHKVKLIPGKRYELKFKAYAKKKCKITVIAIQDEEPWHLYGLNQTFEIDEKLKTFSFRFKAKDPNNRSLIDDCRIIFLLGEKQNEYYFDDFELFEISDSIYARNYNNGIVLLNPNNYSVNLKLPKKFKKIKGNQAPKYQIIIDNENTNNIKFSNINDWIKKKVDSGLWKVYGPFYHDWGDNCLITKKKETNFEFLFKSPSSDNYTLFLWWPANFHKLFKHCSNVKFQILINNKIIKEGTLDQNKYGDQWVKISKVFANKNDIISIKLFKNDSSNTYIIVDALLIESDDRYNDGSIIDEIELYPMDGIILKNY